MATAFYMSASPQYKQKLPTVVDKEIISTLVFCSKEIFNECGVSQAVGGGVQSLFTLGGWIFVGEKFFPIWN